METQKSTQINATGDVLRSIRRTLNLTIDDVATRTGLTKSSLSHYERGRAIDNGKLLRLISTYSRELTTRTEGSK